MLRPAGCAFLASAAPPRYGPARKGLLAMARGGGETHFGERTVPAGGQAGPGRRRVPFGGAPLRPDERPDVGRAAPRLEGRAGHRGQPAEHRTSRSRCSTLPAAPATSPSAWPQRAAPAPASPSATSTPRCCASAPNARSSAGSTTASPSSRAMPKSLRYPDRSFDCVTIAFGIRNVPRIERALREAFRVLRIGGRFLCLEFSSVDVPGLDALYELYSFQVIPRIGQAVTGDREAYQYLVEFDPQISQAEGVRADDRARRLPPRVVHADDRRRGRAAFGLAACDLRPLPSRPSWRAPASCSRARACWRWSTRGRCRCRPRARSRWRG